MQSIAVQTPHMADDAKIIHPRRHISQKVPKTGGPSPGEAIMAALGAAEELMDQYQGWAVDDLEKLWKSFNAMAAAGNIGPDEIREMFDIAHEIRGQGGTFGFDLISTIGDSLCKFLDGRARLAGVELEVIKVHILAMKAVFRQDLSGAQPQLLGDLKELLELLRAKVDLGSNFGVGPVTAG